MMPVGGAASRANQKTALAGILHEKKVDQSLGDLLEKLEGEQVGALLCPPAAAVRGVRGARVRGKLLWLRCRLWSVVGLWLR